MVYKDKIRDLDHLEDQLAMAWDVLSQEEPGGTIMSFRKHVRLCIVTGGK